MADNWTTAKVDDVKPGDVIEVEAEGIGVLKNGVIDEA